VAKRIALVVDPIIGTQVIKRLTVENHYAERAQTIRGLILLIEKTS
jgi:hypothetical protein